MFNSSIRKRKEAINRKQTTLKILASVTDPSPLFGELSIQLGNSLQIKSEQSQRLKQTFNQNTLQNSVDHGNSELSKSKKTFTNSRMLLWNMVIPCNNLL